MKAPAPTRGRPPAVRRAAFLSHSSIALAALLISLVFFTFSPGPCAAESLADKAERLRQELIEKRRDQRQGEAAAGGFAAAVEDAEARARAVAEEVAAATAEAEAVAAEIEALEAKASDLEARHAAVHQAGSRRAASVYGAARLGASAAGWGRARARAARLARYLVAVAAVDATELRALDIERGSLVASLDRERGKAEGVSDRLRALRIEEAAAGRMAMRALEDATSSREATERREAESRQAELAAAEEAAATAAEEARRAAEEEEAAAALRAREAEALREAQREQARLAERLAALERSRADAEAAAVAEAAASADPASDEAAASGERRDGSAAAASPGASESDASQPSARERGLLSRIFRSDADSDRFAAERGSLPPPAPGRVVASYGQQHRSGAVYRGMIVRSTGASAVRAVADGRVIFSGELSGTGNTVIVAHGSRFHTVYARLGSLSRREGDRVRAGDAIGAMASGDGDLHFEVRDSGKAVDPAPWVRGGETGSLR